MINTETLRRWPMSAPEEGARSNFLRFLVFPSQSQNMEAAKLVWLVRLRWLSLFGFTMATAPALFTRTLALGDVSTYVGLLGLLFLANLGSHIFLFEKPSVSPLMIALQMTIDLVAVTLLLEAAGGARNPLLALLLLQAALGGLLIVDRYSVPFLLLVLAALGFLQLEFVRHATFEDDPHVLQTTITYLLLALVFWFVMRSLGRYLERQTERASATELALAKQDRLRAVGALSAGFSHEFASPLNTAKLRLERLARLAPGEDVAEALGAITACENVVRRMNSAQFDRREYQFKTVRVGELLRDIVESWREDHPETHVDLVLDNNALGSLPPLNFAQVVLNLLDNAQEASRSARIVVALGGSADKFSLEVRDDGPGFPASVLQQIGEPFVTTKSAGTGLGLYVSHLFCFSLGGDLSLTNLNPGARVSLTWPNLNES